MASCNSISSRKKIASKIAARAGFDKRIVRNPYFSLLTYARLDQPSNQTLNVYIEGDGLAWKSKDLLSDNPTPTNPIALRMAASDYHGNVLYIARPCQYVNLKLELRCDSRFWSEARFSSPVIDTVNQVIDRFVLEYGFTKINLYGHSGGAAVAVLAAAFRNDVASIDTIAGNLDHKYFTKFHGVTPMDQSLNPINFINKVKNIEQRHIAGEDDAIIPPKLVKHYVDVTNAANNKITISAIVVKNATHEYKKWPEIWSNFINEGNMLN